MIFYEVRSDSQANWGHPKRLSINTGFEQYLGMLI